MLGVDVAEVDADGFEVSVVSSAVGGHGIPVGVVLVVVGLVVSDVVGSQESVS